MKRIATAVLLATLLGLSCAEPFDPQSLVKGLRVLGIRAEPPEARPGTPMALEALVVDSVRSRPPSILWVGCDADPFGQGRSACTDTAVLNDPGQLSSSDGGLPAGVKLIGFGNRALYATPKDLFSVLPEGDVRRVEGTVGVVLALAVGEDVPLSATPEELRAVFDRVRAKETAAVFALFRVRISENLLPNKNPSLSRLLRSGIPLPLGGTLQALPGASLDLEVTAPDDAFETFVQRLPNSAEETAEKLIGAWYSSMGELKLERVALRSDVVQTFTAPDGGTKFPIPENREGSLWVVVRDTRGGQTWMQTPTYVCDSSLPAPTIASVEAPKVSTTLTLRGQNLESVLEVSIGDRALTRGAYVSSRQTWEAPLTGLDAGTYDVKVLSRGCHDITAPRVLLQ